MEKATIELEKYKKEKAIYDANKVKGL